MTSPFYQKSHHNGSESRLMVTMDYSSGKLPSMASLNRNLLKSTGKLALGNSRQYNTASALSHKYGTTLESTNHY